MARYYDPEAPKRAVNMTLDEDLVRRAFAGNPTDQVEKLLVDFVIAETKRRADEEGSLDAAIDGWNTFEATYGSFADDHSDL